MPNEAAQQGRLIYYMTALLYGGCRKISVALAMRKANSRIPRSRSRMSPLRFGKVYLTDADFFSKARRCRTIAGIFCCAHCVSSMMKGTSDRPISVSLYSTLGGTSG